MVSSTTACPSLAAPTPWLNPTVLFVVFHSPIASVNVAAWDMMCRCRSTHGKPRNVTSSLSKFASCTVTPIEEMPVIAPQMPAQPTLACAYSPEGGWWIVMSLWVLIPICGSQSKFLPVYSCPLSVRVPQTPNMEQDNPFHLLAKLSTKSSMFSRKVSFILIFQAGGWALSSSKISFKFFKSPGKFAMTAAREAIRPMSSDACTFLPACVIPSISSIYKSGTSLDKYLSHCQSRNSLNNLSSRGASPSK
mmetsp:Transcript_30109/g.50349  ORF Transcript_30109/g.50349 Transcript_30109/m.50349 type:complete len:249 (+) Transcript_30109:478-1224(+)